tara:strand:- start:2968 stop:3153 length:186 start_codon:yes stop_codon:yes gene_type:complete
VLETDHLHAYAIINGLDAALETHRCLKGDELMILPINGELAALLSALPKSNVGYSDKGVES